MPKEEVAEKHEKMYEADLKKIPPRVHRDADSFGIETHGHGKIKICVSGAAETGHCGLDAYEKGKELGREIVQQDAVLVTGATIGIPLFAAVGAKEKGGLSIGFSPAASEREHLETYKLPLDYMDIIVYTGFGYPGRDLLLTRSSDAVVLGCGRIGTVHEFTIAYEDKKPIGILEGEWETDEVLKYMMEASHRAVGNVIFDNDPKAIIERLIEMVKRQKQELNLVYNNHDGWSGTKGNLIL